MAFHKAKALQEAEKSVAQGKIAQAIKQYLEILENDPSDVSLLNTVGDLHIRDRNIAEGLRQFHRLAEAYTRDGFNVKAIAIYRKISKVDPNSPDTLLKLAELYQLQGLSREAREQYLQAVEFFKKRNQPERVLEVCRKLVQLDPENINFRNRFAGECEQIGKREEAAESYMEAAEILMRRNDHAGAASALKKAGGLDPKNSKVQLQLAQLALAGQQPEEAEKIINSLPELKSDPAGKRILLDSYIATGNLSQAENLVLEVFQANPLDFGPVASVSALLVQKPDIEEAYRLLSGVAEQMIAQRSAGPLLEALRGIRAKAPKHIPTLELMHKVCERTADELTLPEVLEALGRIHEEAGDLEKAEAAYLKLTEREPENENYRGLLKVVQQKLGRHVEPIEFPAREMALSVQEEEARPKPAGVDANQEAMVKEALENSDLFSRYNLIEKAVAELEKVLQVYPDQVDIHQRILEISRKGFPERAAQAATQLARIFKGRGDQALAEKYHSIASAKGALAEIALPSLPSTKKVDQPAAPPPPPAEKPGAGVPTEFSVAAIAPRQPVDAPPVEFSFGVSPPEPSSQPPAAPPPPPAPHEKTVELDLSEDLAAMGAFEIVVPDLPAPEPVVPPPVDIPPPFDLAPPIESPAVVAEPAPPPVLEEPAPILTVPAEKTETPSEPVAQAEPVTPVAPAAPVTPVEENIPIDLEDSRIEVEFYLDNGFLDEARQAMEVLEKKYPGNSLVAELRQKVDGRTGIASGAEPLAPVVPADIPPAAGPAVKLEAPPEIEPAEPPVVAETPVIPEAPVEALQAVPEVPSLPETEPKSEPEAAPVAEVLPEPEEEWELPSGYAIIPETGPAIPAPATADKAPSPEVRISTPPMESVSMLPKPAPRGEEPVGVESGGMDMLGDLAGDLASSMEGIAAAGDTPAEPPPAQPAAQAQPPADGTRGAAQLDSLLAEMEEPGGAEAEAAKDDPQTHYNLGVAFREMGLLDEAIGEFQKVVKGAGKENFPPNFLQACSLLAICFMEKKMPAIAVKWYVRALETPDLDDEALMSLQYDLGIAYELAGDARSALERFTEVYSQNIDFRDVAEKIRELQQKA
jgi:tetratricopeptide (TPR) repeat protein